MPGRTSMDPDEEDYELVAAAGAPGHSRQAFS